MLKTRAGASVKLIDLLDEAVRRARAIVEEKNPTLPTEVKDRLGDQIGVGAVKYADLSSDRIKDYTFAWDRMLALDGNTAPYLQYAHARICSIFRRAGERPDLETARVEINHPAEREVVLQLVEFHPSVVASVGSNQPHRLCTYLFELAQTFSRFYEDCPVLGAATPDETESRLVLCDLTAGVLSTGLGLLGIAAPQEI
jgi:arginyl-tRNA synthetase